MQGKRKCGSNGIVLKIGGGWCKYMGRRGVTDGGCGKGMGLGGGFLVVLMVEKREGK